MFVDVVWHHFILSVSIRLNSAQSYESVEILISRPNFQNFWKKCLKQSICMAAFREKFGNSFHLGLSQVAIKRYWEVASILRFII